MRFSWAGCPRPVGWLLMCAVASALWHRFLGGSLGGGVREWQILSGAGGPSGRQPRALMLPAILQSRAALQRSLDAFLPFRGGASLYAFGTVSTMPQVDFVCAGQWRA